MKAVIEYDLDPDDELAVVATVEASSELPFVELGLPSLRDEPLYLTSTECDRLGRALLVAAGVTLA